MAATLLTIGSALGGASALPLELGPSHPMNSGFLPVAMETADGRVTAFDPRPGQLHRGAEALFEVRDLRQALSLANRHDWQAPLFGELAIALLVERELGVEVPPRAAWIRMLLAEHTRILSHLGFLSFIGWQLGRDDLATDAVRERFRRQTRALTGNRLHPTAVRLGGVAVEPDDAWATAERALVADAARLADRLERALLESGLGTGVAPVSLAVVDAHGLGGPIARASGRDDDLRRGAGGPAAVLADLLAPLDGPTDGDATARFRWMCAEITRSGLLVAGLLDTLPRGELAVRLPNVVKLPEGDAHAAVEAPLGRAGVFVSSRGDKVPWRLSLRTPSLANVSAWPTVLPGTRTEDIAVAVASLPYVTGDLEK